MVINNDKYILFSIANIECTPTDRQLYPVGYMYPRLGTSVLNCLLLGKR